MFDEETVRTYIKEFLDNSYFDSNQMDIALASADKSAFQCGVLHDGVPKITFIEIFHEEWDKKYPK